MTHALMSYATPIIAADAASISQAARRLLAGDLVAIPTETVYGLAGDATNAQAVASIYEAKERPSFNPLIAHMYDLEMARQHGVFSEKALTLARAFWPGSLTLVVPRHENTNICTLASAGLDTLAIRVPAHEAARALLRETGRPLTAPSANPSGRISPTTASHVRDGLNGRIALILDGGSCTIGLESTIVKVIGDEISVLRQGGIPQDEIEALLGIPLYTLNTNNAIEAPGMMSSHYAPGVRMRINVQTPRADEVWLAFGAIATTHDPMLNLSETGNIKEAATNLFDYMHKLDALCTAKGLSGIAVAPIPNQGLGIAINDRLVRASAPR